jgi:hypothetical protein
MSTVYAYRTFAGRRADGTIVTGIVPQFDGSRYASTNCGCASEAMRIWSQQKGKRPSKGSPWPPTGAAIRRETGDTSGGTNPGQTTRASYNEYGIPHAAPRISAFQNVLNYLSAGYAVDLLVGYGPIGDVKSGSPGFRGNHRIVLVGRNSDRRLLLSADPLYDGRRSGIPKGQQWLPQTIIYNAASALILDPSTGRTVADGMAYFIPSLTHNTIPPPQRATVPKGKFMRYNVSAGVITGRTAYNTSGFGAKCTAPQSYPVAPNANVPSGTFKLVRLLEGSREGWYINAKYAAPV